MLRSPTSAPDHLRLLFEYQLAILNRLREDDATMEDSKGINVTHVSEIIRSTDDVSQPSLIAAHLGPKYGVPAHLAVVVAKNDKAKPKAKRVYAERIEPSPSVPPPSTSNNNPLVTPSSKSIALDLGHPLSAMGTTEVTVGGLYDARLLPDYGGPMFEHTHSKLVQKDITDVDGELIPMWETYNKLRTGTLVLMKGRLNVYQMDDKQRDGYKKV